jgi:hypothetical protein
MATLTLCTAGGEQHGLINTLTNSVPFDDFKNYASKDKEFLKKEKKEDDRLVKVEYLNSRGRHERLTKPYCRYAGDPIKIYHLIPGKVYEVPLGFVKEVNGVKNMIRSGFVAGDKDLDGSGTPLEEDQEAEWLHKLVPAGF